MAKNVKKRARLTGASDVVKDAPGTTAERSVLSNAELLSMILHSLNEIQSGRSSASDSDVSDLGDSMPSTINTSAFASLATVSKAFFYASIEILWERMDSLVPFLGYVLPADKDESGRPCPTLSYQNKALAAKDWERFTLYAANTKYLELRSPQAVMAPGWLTYLVNSMGRPHVLFPNIKHLTAGSGDTLSLFVASNVAPVLTSFHLDLHGRSSMENESARALTVGLKQASSILTSLKLVKPTTTSIVEDISQISSLRNLHITVGHYPGTLILSRLANLPVLASLHIVQDLDPFNRAVAAKFPTTFDIQPLLPMEAKLGHLKELCVKANGTVQYLVAAELLPCGLDKITMEVMPDILNTQMVLIPLAGALYARRNPSLRKFDVSLVSEGLSAMANMREIQGLRDDGRFTVKPFINGLAALGDLTHLVIWDVPFLAVDITLQLLRAAESLPNLTYLLVMPEAITHLPVDSLIQPVFQSLETIVKHNRELTVLQLHINTPMTPPVPLKSVSQHPLVTLSLSTNGKGWNRFTTRDKFALAQYLDALFPDADLEFDGGPSPEVEFWQFIQDSMTFYRKGRAQGAARTSSQYV